jgi:hypothetical protein
MYGRLPDQFADYWMTRFPKLLIHSWMAMHCIKREPSLAKYFDKDYDFVKVSDLLYSSVHTVLLRYISYVPNLPIHHCIDILATNVARVWSYRLE